MNSSGESPFKNEAMQFALNNTPNGDLFKTYLTAAIAGDYKTATTLANLVANATSTTLVQPSFPSVMTSPGGLTNGGIGISEPMLQTLAAIKQMQEAAANAAQRSFSTSNSSSISAPLAAPTSTSNTSAAFDGVFRKPELPSLRRRPYGCNVCGQLSNKEGTPLIECDVCHMVSYCGPEHRSFDHKRHKLMCRTYQTRISRSIANEDTTIRSNTTDYSISPTIAINHQMPKSTSSISLSGASSSVLDFICGFLGISEISAAGFDRSSIDGAALKTNSSSFDKRSLDSAVVMDEDVQVIEETNCSRKGRKRPYVPEDLGPNQKGWKDHSKNLLFNTTLQDHMRSLASSGLALNQHQAIALRLRYIAEHVIRSLNEYGWAVVDNFLGRTHCKHTYREIEELYDRGVFNEGQLAGEKEDATTGTSTKDIRSDKTYWFDNSEYKARDAVTIRLLISMIDSVIVHFAKRIPPYEIAGRSRAMIACYPGSGTRYVKHVDNPNRDGRCITSTYYCNDDWVLSEDGGTLRLYPETSHVPMDIDPQADRLVFFWSDHRNPHEVLPVFRHRYAITIWYFDQKEKQEAMEKQRLKDEKERVGSGINHDEINSAPIPEKPKTPPRVIATAIRSNEAKWRRPRVTNCTADDQQSTATRSLIDEEEAREVEMNEITEHSSAEDNYSNFEV
ncbi:Oxoglutarate iron-dependent oxygenase domain containing protein [Aphelenchoides besseyi]|nr:Oxoglutarate iron-dependent oxygenase domain containing protein [Aphelenchoides besseyi]